MFSLIRMLSFIHIQTHTHTDTHTPTHTVIHSVTHTHKLAQIYTKSQIHISRCTSKMVFLSPTNTGEQVVSRNTFERQKLQPLRLSRGIHSELSKYTEFTVVHIQDSFQSTLVKLYYTSRVEFNSVGQYLHWLAC